MHGVVLTGGGARAAYQVGVLKAVSDLMPGLSFPFQVMVGTSAGALNAVMLASGGDIYRHNIDHLEQIWLDIKTSDIYKSNTINLTYSMSQFLRSLISGRSPDSGSGLLDNSPLVPFVKKHVNFETIEQHIESGNIKALGVNACGYRSGQNVCFFQAMDSVKGWEKGQRIGVRTKLGVDHLLASSAIPTIFPPIKINREFFGDGATRQLAHLSPAIHLGASKILVVGVSANRIYRNPRQSTQLAPNMGIIMENVLNGIFIDTLEYDLDRVKILNHLLELIPAQELEKNNISLRPIKIVEISPTKPIFEIARKYIHRLPALIRRIMGRNLEKGEGGLSLSSYLLFDSEFCRELISLGYTDAHLQAAEIENFFSN